MKHQVVVIHGGDTFDTYASYLAFLKDFQIDFERYRVSKPGWKRTLGEKLGTGYEVIAPDMPDKANAKYVEWKIWFEKFIPYLEPEIILVGHSLGGTFLIKYLSENAMPKKVLGLFLIAPCFESTAEDSLADFVLQGSLSLVSQQAPDITLYHSEDDPVTPFANFKKFQSKFPGATARTFRDRGHFNQDVFPELIADIRAL